MPSPLEAATHPANSAHGSSPLHLSALALACSRPMDPLGIHRTHHASAGVVPRQASRRRAARLSPPAFREPILIIANHVTTYDGPLIQYALPGPPAPPHRRRHVRRDARRLPPFPQSRAPRPHFFRSALSPGSWLPRCSMCFRCPACAISSAASRMPAKRSTAATTCWFFPRARAQRPANWRASVPASACWSSSPIPPCSPSPFADWAS